MRYDARMEEPIFDRAAMGKLAKALAFICSPDHPTTLALKAAAESGSEKDIKAARAASSPPLRTKLNRPLEPVKSRTQFS